MTNKSISTSTIDPFCLATTIGSLPHTDVVSGTRLMFKNTPEIPGWVQFPKLNYYENMMVQFTEGMPGLVIENERVYFDTNASGFTSQLTDFYAGYLSATEEANTTAHEKFAISEQYAAGFPEFLKQLPEQKIDPKLLKGQVTGPFTLGINLTDQNKRSAYFDDQLRDMIVKSVCLKATWQLYQLSQFSLKTIILIDEPALLSFGTQICLTVSREDIIHDLNEVGQAIHTHGGIAGVHCEANTDWSMLMETNLDILVFDAYDHMQAITLYPDHLKKFFDQGGLLGWGIVPTLDRAAASNETLSSLHDRFNKNVERLVHLGFEKEFLLQKALITPSCGAGGVLTEPLAKRVLTLLNQLSTTLRKEYGFAC